MLNPNANPDGSRSGWVTAMEVTSHFQAVSRVISRKRRWGEGEGDPLGFDWRGTEGQRIHFFENQRARHVVRAAKKSTPFRFFPELP